VAFATHQHVGGNPSLRARVQHSRPLKTKRAILLSIPAKDVRKFYQKMS